MTGLIAGGKSTTARRLAGWGGLHLDADAIAAEITRQPAVASEIDRRLGGNLIGDDGQLDRPAVAAAVFGEDGASVRRLRTLESIVHPRVRQTMLNHLRESEDAFRFAVLDVPLLIQSNWHTACDDIVCVLCDRATIQRRIEQRGWTTDQYDRRTNRQTELSIKLLAATLTIDTTDAPTADQRLQNWFQRRIKDLPTPSPTCQIDCRGWP